MREKCNVPFGDLSAIIGKTLRYAPDICWLCKTQRIIRQAIKCSKQCPASSQIECTFFVMANVLNSS
jgi:hypothetical protein